MFKIFKKISQNIENNIVKHVLLQSVITVSLIIYLPKINPTTMNISNWINNYPTATSFFKHAGTFFTTGKSPVSWYTFSMAKANSTSLLVDALFL